MKYLVLLFMLISINVNANTHYQVKIDPSKYINSVKDCDALAKKLSNNSKLTIKETLLYNKLIFDLCFKSIMEENSK